LFVPSAGFVKIYGIDQTYSRNMAKDQRHILNNKVLLRAGEDLRDNNRCGISDILGRKS